MFELRCDSLGKWTFACPRGPEQQITSFVWNTHFSVPFFTVHKLLDVSNDAVHELFFKDHTFQFSRFFSLGNIPIASIVFVYSNFSLSFLRRKWIDIVDKVFENFMIFSIDSDLPQMLNHSAFTRQLNLTSLQNNDHRWTIISKLVLSFGRFISQLVTI